MLKRASERDFPFGGHSIMSSDQTGMDTYSPVPTYKKRRDSTLAEKVKILELLQQPKASQSSVARNMGLSQSTISRVMKRREEILERWNQNENPSRKRNRPIKHAKVDEALLEWLLFAKANNLPISGPILMRQAEAIAREIGYPQFKASNGWLWRWKERYRLFYRGDSPSEQKEHDDMSQNKFVKILPKAIPMFRIESNSIADERLSSCYYLNNGERNVHMPSERHTFPQGLSVNKSVFLAQIAKDYHLEDIFCAVGSTFHFRVLSRQGMTTGLKDTVYIWFCCNMSGTEKLKLLVTHNLPQKSLGTHYLSPVSLKANENGFLSDTLLTEWLFNWDAKLGRQDRKILLAFTAHNAGLKVKLRNISLCIFPKDIPTSNHQFGQELVNEFNLFYRQLLLERLKEDSSAGGRMETSLLQKMGEMSLVEASYTMNKAWLRVSPYTINSSFQKQEVIRILCSATIKPPPETRLQKIKSSPISEESNAVLSPLLTAGQESYREVTIKEENDDGHEYPQYETTCASQPFPNQKVKADLSCGGNSKLRGLETHLELKDVKEDFTTVVITEDSSQYVDVKELRQACDVVQHFLTSKNQDLSIFHALQGQIEKCLTSPSDKKTFNCMRK
ncbi:tigger transposable element-derived protein 4-like [Hyperolius riggenbachi]|uniref:tigger transposable element-derived protein 4-like n=1 Tax=Hyperolius riggenbachi TaxID=752182 RepID=UPI0035A28351